MQKPPADDLAKAQIHIDNLRSQLEPLFDALPVTSNSAIRFEVGEEQ